MNDFSKQAQDIADRIAEQVRSVIPQNKNAYEIRTQVLNMAQEMAHFEFGSKQMLWEVSAERDPEGRILETSNAPKVPTAKEVLKTAKEYYDFINTK